MGKRERIAAFAALTLGVGMLEACSPQGPVQRERWGYQHLERLRDEVFREMVGRDAETRREVARRLSERVADVPFRPAARALAFLRGVEADDAFLLRATLSAFVLPEVVDPEGATAVCRDLNVSLFLPFTVAQPGALVFEIVVRDAAGTAVFESVVRENNDVADLRRAKVVVTVPGAELEDGRYVFWVRTLIDGVEPHWADPMLSTSFHVQRGYQARSEAAMNRVREDHADLDPVAKALLLGLGAEVSRAYQGQAFDGESDAVADLRRLEVALDNVANERHVLHGLQGDVPVTLPAGDGSIECVLRLDPRFHPAEAPEARPLLVFADGAPAYGVDAHRPISPGVRGPRWLARAMPDVGVGGDFHVAFLASPGNGRDYSAALPAAVASLRALLGVGDRPVVLVCEREAAAIAGFSVGRLRQQIDGLVLLGAGAIPIPALESLGDCRVRVAMLNGYPSSESLVRTLTYVEQKRASGQWSGDFERLVVEEPAWVFGTRSLVEPIRAFMQGFVDG